jgi:hypothetical protein
MLQVLRLVGRLADEVGWKTRAPFPKMRNILDNGLKVCKYYILFTYGGDIVVRKNITVTEQQDRRIKEEQERTGMNLSEIIRRAFDEYIEKRNSK